jgi:hypothetical protein
VTIDVNTGECVLVYRVDKARRDDLGLLVQIEAPPTAKARATVLSAVLERVRR